MLPYLWITIAVVVLDQLTKWAAVEYLVRHAEVNILPFLSLTLVFNTGAAFGFLSDASGWQNTFFISVAVVACAVIFFMLRRLTRNELLTAIGLVLIMGGAIGNLIDRVTLGYVIDFIDFYYPSLGPSCLWPFHFDGGACHWPVFNIADAAITIGALLVVLDVLGIGARKPPA